MAAFWRLCIALDFAVNDLSLGLIGCGEIVWRKYAPLLAVAQGVRVTSVCARHEDSARAAAKRLNAAHVFTDHRRMIDAGVVDAVIVASPHPYHADQAVYALERGVHALVEKPVATTLADLERLSAAAGNSAAGMLLLPFFGPALLDTLRENARPERLGKIVAISADYSGPGPRPEAKWKFSRAAAGGGVMQAHSIYALDLIASVMGPAISVSARANTQQCERHTKSGDPVASDIDDNAVIMLEYEGGQYASVRSCWSYPVPRRRIEFQGAEGELVLSGGSIRRVYRDDATGNDVSEPCQVAGPQESVVDHFLRCARAGEFIPADVEKSVHIHEQVLKAAESARSGKVEALSTTFSL